ncbi:hypothetical protein SAMN05216302_102115 [Nitrosomonas aestuarii]|uniref:Uncharacterized protein n=1 Tax=Nitrosomonas aestuarii TaxID=52441 RepID=A0A1I4DE70_9PROT|nr:hypothetical protein [Nitrosomonas aestuarii]SFK92114.1 hypothetical protein SAMN05216302_102115 [Nitrosomonas aestuarii]
MAIELLDHQTIIDYLGAQAGKLRSVDGAAGLASASSNIKQPPVAFVVPLNDRASANATGTMVTRQNNTTRFAVIVAVQNLRDPRGDRARDDLRILRQDIMALLHGWTPNEAFDPIQYSGGRMLKLTNQVLWWQDEFSTSHIIRSI